MPLVHAVTTARLDVGPHPDADAAPDPSASNSFAKTFGKHHDERRPKVGASAAGAQDGRRCATAFGRVHRHLNVRAGCRNTPEYLRRESHLLEGTAKPTCPYTDLEYASMRLLPA